jgi:hypothetical protein
MPSFFSFSNEQQQICGCRRQPRNLTPPPSAVQFQTTKSIQLTAVGHPRMPFISSIHFHYSSLLFILQSYLQILGQSFPFASITEFGIKIWQRSKKS